MSAFSLMSGVTKFAGETRIRSWVADSSGMSFEETVAALLALVEAADGKVANGEAADGGATP